MGDLAGAALHQAAAAVIVFLDASAIIKLYRQEDGSATMRELVGNPELRDAFISSDIVALEVFVRLAKQGRAGGKGESRVAREAMRSYARHRAGFLQVLPAGPQVVQGAELAAVQYRDSGAGTLDLLHTVFALRLRESAPGQPLVFVVADRKLRSLAERIGFRVFDPETDDPASLV
jgi:predicted nucleic acid-binding protein